MPTLPLATSRYDRSELPALTLQNYYYETTPVVQATQSVLVPRPRLKAFAQAGTGPISGLYRKGGVMAASGYSGAIIAKSGTALYRVTQTGLPGVGTATAITGATIEGDFRMVAEGNESVVVLACGTKVYSTDGATVSQITFPSSFQVAAVDTLNSYFLFASELGRFYWSAVGGTTVSALDYATAESQPDVLLTLKVAGDVLWLFGRLSLEAWQPTGDLDLPFQRIGGRIFGIGVTARETVQRLNVGGTDTVCWLGTDRRVYRLNPNPERISDHALEEVLQGLSISTAGDGSNPYATTYSWNGHDFYVLHVPGHGSYAYDLATGKWSDVTSYGRTLFRTSVWAVGPNAQPLFGDDTSNQIWELSLEAATDGTDPVVFEFSGLVEMGEPARNHNVSLDVTVGGTDDPSADPTIDLAVSDDMGETWSQEIAAPLGRQGERHTRVMWTRLGMLRRPGRLFRWRTTEPVTVRNGRINEGLR